MPLLSRFSDALSSSVSSVLQSSLTAECIHSYASMWAFERGLACVLLSLLPAQTSPTQRVLLPHTPPSPDASTTLLSYDQCYVCAVEHKVALLVLLLRALRCATLSLTPFRETDRPLYVTSSTDQRSVKPEQQTGRHEFSGKHYYVLSALPGI